MTRLSVDSRVSVATFLVVLWIPLVVTLLSRDADVSLTEQRALAPLPPLAAGADALAGLPAALETYYDDRMGLRDDLIRAWAWLHIEIFGVSPSESLIVGKDGWLFFGDENAVAQYRGLVRFDDLELQRWGQVLEERRAWLARRDISYLLVLVPNKHRIYGEYMPDALAPAGDGSQLDQLVVYLESHSRVRFLDLREALAAAAVGQRIYHRTDTHWNDLGAYAAYRAIIERLGEDVPALAHHPPLAVRPLTRTTPGLGLARIVGLSRAYPEESFDLVITEPRAELPKKRRAAFEDRVRRQLPFGLGTGDDDLPVALIFRDSFADALVPFLSESFARIVYVWNRDMDPRVVEIERPQIVIQEIAERFLDRPPRSVEAARSR